MKRTGFRRLSLGIRGKITALNGVFLLLLALSLGYIMREMSQATVAIEKQRQTLSRLEQAGNAAQQFASLKFWLTDLSLSWLNESEASAEQIQQQLAASLAALEETDQELVAAVRPEISAYADLMVQSVDAYVDGKRVQGNALVAEARQRAEVVDAKLSKLLTTAGASTREAGEFVIAANVRVRKAAIGFLVVGTTFGGLLGWLFGRSIAKPLIQAVEGVKRVARGDLSRQVEVRSRDEIGQINEALNQAVEGMRTALQTEKVDWQEVGLQRQRENETMAEMVKKQAMVENSPVNIILADRDLNITYANPATLESLKTLADLLPVPVNQIVGSNVDIFHKNPAHQRGILSNPKNLPHRAMIELGDQKLDLRVNAIRDEQGEYLGPMLIWENITEKTAAEEREKLQTESLRQNTDRMLSEVGGLVDAAREGRLSVRANADLFEGGFADMVRGVNETIEAILTPVNEAAATLEKIAAQDLTARVTGDYQGDHAALKDNLNKAVENLDQALSQVTCTVEQVNGSAGEIASGSQNLALGAQNQASSLQQISSSLEQMASMTKQNADNSNQAKLLSGEAQSSADRGNASMRQMTDAIDRIKESSDQTAKIVKTIDEIAFQTNLLALNAAVEAARAGEAGKGFAVVAEEVRNLAQRSAEAARNTADMIEESVKNAEGGVRITEEVAKVLGEIAEGSRKVNDLVAEIAAASNEQSQGIEQVNTSVAQLDKVTQQNAANSEESSSAAQALNQQADNLGRLVSGFQLNQPESDPRPDKTARDLAKDLAQAARCEDSPREEDLERVHASRSNGKG